jgi:hypothetical protein
MRGLKCGEYTNEDINILGINVKKESFTIIGNDVWIGDGVVIMSGVNIGTGSVIGANAVVTKDVPPFSVYGGVPAKKIRNRLPEDISKKLLELEWWELSHETLKSAPLDNIFEFIEVIGNKGDEANASYDTYKVI